MSHSAFAMKRNDRKPDYEAQLVSGGKPIDLVGCTVRFYMRVEEPENADPKVNGAAVVVDADLALVKYEWADGDTDTEGTYIAEWEITYPGGQRRTVPSEDYVFIRIVRDLAGPGP